MEEKTSLTPNNENMQTFNKIARLISPKSNKKKFDTHAT